MSDKHDAWLEGIGVEVDNLLARVDEKTEDPASSHGDAGRTPAVEGSKDASAATAPAPAAGATAAPPDYSGDHWVSRYPGSTATSDLDSAFQGKVTAFIKALESATPKASVRIGATLRPPERAHLMHYAWAIAREGLDPVAAPKQVVLNGVEIPIEWVHVDAAGKPDLKASKAAAEEMVSGKPDYGMSAQAVLDSRHIRGLAIDMTITWAGKMKIQDATGTEVEVDWNDNVDKNTDLHKVGASYGVIKLVSTSKPDPPHWSSDGH